MLTDRAPSRALAEGAPAGGTRDVICPHSSVGLCDRCRRMEMVTLTYHVTEMDRAFLRGELYGHRRERSALRPGLVAAWEDGHRRGVATMGCVLVGLWVVARMWGRR